MLVLLAATCCSLASGQFVPQSHLGRLVQSITSPLVLNSASGDGPPDGYTSDPSSYHSTDASGEGADSDEPQRIAQRGRHPSGGRQQHLQQAPSQHREIPQHYYGSSASSDGEDRDQGSAPSNQKPAQEYQMGAYLGPTMDDKELNGVFNSNDERDDDEAPGASAGYDDSSMGRANGGGRAAASQQYQREGEGYGPPASGYERSPSRPQSGYDEDSADEEDDNSASHPAQGRRGGRARYSGSGGLNQAASQYQQQDSQSGPGQQGQMMAAANGYVPYGYANGPVDLTGLISGLGSDPNQGYQAYNGDGSYPGANYYQQQQRGGQRGGRNQAESMNNGYYQNQGYGPNGGGWQQRQPQANQGDSDDRDNDADED